MAHHRLTHKRRRLVVIGAGGHSKSVVESVDSVEFELYGFIDEYKTGENCGLPIFGPRAEDVPGYHGCNYIIAIGDVRVRKRWYDILAERALPLANVVDKTAIVSPAATIGRGNFVGKMAIINSGVVIGENNLINSMALIEHESTVGNHANLSTRSTINGDVIVEDGVFLGSGSTCNGQITLGAWSTIGSGSVVISDVPANEVFAGVPAKRIRACGGGRP